MNLKLSKNLMKAAERYNKNYGYRNIQELIAESLREKVIEDNGFDESFSDKEIELIDSLIEQSIKKKEFVSEEELTKSLLE